MFCEYHKIETLKRPVSCNSWWSPDKAKYIHWLFLVFQFCDDYLEVPLISMTMYYLELCFYFLYYAQSSTLTHLLSPFLLANFPKTLYDD